MNLKYGKNNRLYVKNNCRICVIYLWQKDFTHGSYPMFKNSFIGVGCIVDSSKRYLLSLLSLHWLYCCSQLVYFKGQRKGKESKKKYIIHTNRVVKIITYRHAVWKTNYIIKL